MDRKQKTIDYIIDIKNELVWCVQRDEKLKSFKSLHKLLAYMEDENMFRDDAIIEVVYVEDEKNASELESIIEIVLEGLHER